MSLPSTVSLVALNRTGSCGGSSFSRFQASAKPGAAQLGETERARTAGHGSSERGSNGRVGAGNRPSTSAFAKAAVVRFWPEARDSARLVLRWLALALVLEVFLQRLVPDAWIVSLFSDDAGASIPLAVIVGAPMYLDGYAALSLVRGLMDSGSRKRMAWFAPAGTSTFSFAPGRRSPPMA